MQEAYAAVQATIGAKLFTVSALSSDGLEWIRIFTSAEDAFPVRGRKPALNLTGLQARRSTFHSDREAIVDYFPDKDEILALGCTTAINVRVTANDAVIGSINFLDEEGRYSITSVSIAEDLARRMRSLVADHVPLK